TLVRIRRCAEAIFVFFFFSSRRRHTRFSRDWSSDVCSSDLVAHHHRADERRKYNGQRPAGGTVEEGQTKETERIGIAIEDGIERSEERRVGKECRWRWWAES